MVVFSSTDISWEQIERAVELAAKRHAELVILDVRDKAMSERVADMAENIGFMGEKVVGELRKDISHERCDVIYKKLTAIEELAKKKGVPYEIVVEKGPFVDSIMRVARKRRVKTIVCQRRDRALGKEDFEVIVF